MQRGSQREQCTDTGTDEGDAGYGGDGARRGEQARQPGEDETDGGQEQVLRGVGAGKAAGQHSTSQVGGVKRADERDCGLPGKSDVVAQVAREPEAESELQ